MRLLAILLPLLAVVKAQDLSMLLKDIGGVRKAMEDHLRKEAAGCLDVAPPPLVITKIEECFKEAIGMNFNEFRQNDFLPDFMVVKKLLNDFKVCHMKTIGLEADAPPPSNEELVEKSLIPTWTGEDLPKFMTYLTDCLKEVDREQTTLEVCLDVERCMLKKVINYCETIGESPGEMVPQMLLLYTLREPPKCSNVVVPQEYQMNWVKCIDQSRKNMTTNINFINEITSETNMMSKVKMFGQGFCENVFWGTCECMSTYEPSVLNPETMTVDMTNAAEFVRNFAGWDSSDDSTAIYDGMMKCNMYLTESVPPAGETRKEGIKRMMNAFKRFDSCFLPVLADTCGITNKELGMFFLPMMNKKMTDTIMTEFLKSVVFMGVEHAKYFWENGLPPPLKMFS